MKIKLICIHFLFVLTIKVQAQNDCSQAITVCGNANIEGLTVIGIGNQELTELNSCGSQEHNSVWFKLQIKTGGTLGFLLIPESSSINIDFDFFVFGPNASCNALGQAIRCSTTNPNLIHQNNNHTGMNENEIDTSEGPGMLGNSFVKWLNVAAGESYFLMIDRPVGSSNFSLQWTGTATFNTAPTVDVPNGVSIDINKCDNDGTNDFSTAVDLTINTPIITGTQSDVMVTYHINQNDALTGTNPIQNPDHFINTINPQSIFTRITNIGTDCFDTSMFFIRIKSTLDFIITKSSICDDSIDGNDSNGQAVFDLNKVTLDVLGNQNISSLTVKYFLTQNDANTNSNELPQFFYNTVPNYQSIYINVFSSNLCKATSKIDLIVNPLPQRITATLVQCGDVNAGGISIFNLNEANSGITNNDTNLSTTFFKNSADAINNANTLSTVFSNSINPQTIIARLTNNTTGCYSFSPLELKVNVISENTSTTDSVCDDDGIEDGKHIFNLNNSNIPITNTQQISYYLNANDVLLEQNVIINPSTYLNESAYNQIIYARTEDNNDCYDISKINLVVEKLPNVQTSASAIVCSNLPLLYVGLNAGIQDGSPVDYTYLWKKEERILSGETASTLNVNTPGIYTVEVFNSKGCSRIRTITVNASNAAHFGTIIIEDLSDSNTVKVNSIGLGNYEYSLDLPNGPFQESNFFENVLSGIHTIYVNDKNGCGIEQKTIAVLGISKFFTPNGDGFNDYWNIQGVDNSFNKGATIFIYDRYGKLITQLRPTSKGWDGTFTGKQVPVDDYWYTLKLEDGREVKGHFSLKR